MNQNIDLNPGGLLGASAFGGAAAAMLFGVGLEGENGRGIAKLFIIAVIGGAIGGNWLWTRLKPKPLCPSCGRKLLCHDDRQCVFCGQDLLKP